MYVNEKMQKDQRFCFRTSCELTWARRKAYNCNYFAGITRIAPFKSSLFLRAFSPNTTQST